MILTIAKTRPQFKDDLSDPSQLPFATVIGNFASLEPLPPKTKHAAPPLNAKKEYIVSLRPKPCAAFSKNLACCPYLCRGLHAVHVPGASRGFDVAEVKVHGFVPVFRGDFFSRGF